MSLEEEEAGQTSEYILVAKLNNAKNISNLLKAVHFKEVRPSYKFNLTFLV